MKDTEAQNAITGGALERLINVLEEQNKILRDQCKQAGRTMIDPDDYEIVRSARPIKCYICREAPAAYRETFAARDRDGRCHVRGLCEQCYQALQPEEP